MITQDMHNTAEFSPDRKYRYTLWRIWDDTKPFCQFIGLNPSTADETNDDPTIRRCIQFAKDWGYGGLCMTNIFAYRATDPKDMKAQADPIGPENNKWLNDISIYAGVVIAAWGTHGIHIDREKNIKIMYAKLGQKMKCLGTTMNGHPKHPLYLKANIVPEIFR